MRPGELGVRQRWRTGTDRSETDGGCERLSRGRLDGRWTVRRLRSVSGAGQPWALSGVGQCRDTGAGGGFVAGEVPVRVGMISLCRSMAAWSSGGEHVEKDARCSVRSTMLVTSQGVQGQGWQPLRANAWASVSGWGGRQQGGHGVDGGWPASHAHCLRGL